MAIVRDEYDIWANYGTSSEFLQSTRTNAEKAIEVAKTIFNFGDKRIRNVYVIAQANSKNAKEIFRLERK